MAALAECRVSWAPLIPPIVNRHGERLAALFVPGASAAPGSPGASEEPGASGRPLVVFGHGLTSDKDRPWSRALSAALADRGIASLRIAFSGNGDSDGRFVDSTISKEVEDLGAVLDVLDGWRVGYVGHSMGASVGLLRAVDDERLTALVSLAAITDPVAFERRLLGRTRPGEPILDKEHCPYGTRLRLDLLGHDGALLAAATRVSRPWLIVHGTDDLVVPVEDSERLHAAAAERAELVRLDDVDHAFTGPGLERMLAAVVPWLVRWAGR